MSDNELIRESIAVKDIGNRLKSARLSKGWSIEEAADKLKYKSRWIEHLEADAYHEFYALAYAKGYLSAYAKLLGLPVNEIMDDLATYELENVVVSHQPKLVNFNQITTRDRPIRWTTYGIAGLLLVLVVLWWHSVHTTNEKQVNTTIETPKPMEENHLEVF